MKFILPKRLSEATIQAEFYSQAKEAGLNIYLEYKHENNRFDAVIYKDGIITHIIEFKSYKTNKAGKVNTKQINRYKAYGVPVILITRLDQIRGVISFLLSLE
ncbi:hypothetical protein KAU11_07510 [Candidatus Babeliales bacterium]|nr:hypothetical protein [Candidatus Babeliales bacterium]